MCSVACASPGMTSSMLPASYVIWVVTTGASWFGTMMTCRPLANVVSTTAELSGCAYATPDNKKRPAKIPASTLLKTSLSTVPRASPTFSPCRSIPSEASEPLEHALQEWLNIRLLDLHTDTCGVIANVVKISSGRHEKTVPDC